MTTEERAGENRAAPATSGLSPGAWLGVLAGFAFASLLLFRPALNGAPIFDDVAYTVDNPLVAKPNLESAASVLRPAGAPAQHVGHYVPVALVLHAVAWQLFDGTFFGHHVLNVLLHALNATLLGALLLASGLPRTWALLGAAWFAFHPANVEAVAWVAQLRSVAALGFALAALQVRGRWPALAAASFALGLLCNILAAFALPVALAWNRAARGRPVSGRHPNVWMLSWAMMLVLVAIPEVAAFRAREGLAMASADVWEQLRTAVGVGTRYGIMAATGYGVSALHQLAPLPLPIGKVWMAGLLLGIGLLWRIAAGLRAGSVEAGWWLGAVAAFAPVAQLVPFYFALADRYLYFMLPGLIGGGLLFGRAIGLRLVAVLTQRGHTAGRLNWLATAAALAVAAILPFSFQHAHTRAQLWQNESLVLLDAARHYPAGPVADYIVAVRAAARNELAEAMIALRAATDWGLHRVFNLRNDPRLLTLHPTPAFRALWRELDPNSPTHPPLDTRQIPADASRHAPVLAGANKVPTRRCDAGENPPNVLLVTFDTTRRDHISIYGYDRPTTPHFDRIARQGVRFDHAYAAAPETAPSHASLLTGQYPIGHGLLQNGLSLAEDHFTLAERLAAAGYDTAAFVGSFALDARFGLAQGFSHYDDDFVRGESTDEAEHWEGHLVLSPFDRRANRSLDRAVSWLENERDAKRPFFLFIHYWDPHLSYRPPASFRDMFAGTQDANLKDGDVDLDKWIRWYDGEIAFADWALGMLLAALEDRGLADDTLVIVTADHGEGLMQRGILTHSFYLYEEEVGVPLVMRWPGCLSAGRVVTEPVELVDVVPTVIDLVGAAPAEVHGRSLAAALRGEAKIDPEHSVFLQRRAHVGPMVDHFGGVEAGGEVFGIRRGRWKYIERAEPARRELFDLEADPAERHNRVFEHEEVATDLADRIANWRRTHERAPHAPESVSPEDRAILRELGYVD